MPKKKKKFLEITHKLCQYKLSSKYFKLHPMSYRNCDILLYLAGIAIIAQNLYACSLLVHFVCNYKLTVITETRSQRNKGYYSHDLEVHAKRGCSSLYKLFQRAALAINQ